MTLVVAAAAVWHAAYGGCQRHREDVDGSKATFGQSELATVEHNSQSEESEQSDHARSSIPSATAAGPSVMSDAQTGSR